MKFRIILGFLIFSVDGITCNEKTGILFESERLYFREFTLQDAESLMPIFGDKEVMEYALSHEELKKIFHAMSLEEIYAFLDRVITSYKDRGWGRYAVIKKDDGVLIGYCGLKLQTIGDSEQYPELGYRFAKKYWGNGYATESARAACDYICAILKLPEIICIIDSANTASIRVAQKAGFLFWKIETFYNFPSMIYKKTFNRVE